MIFAACIALGALMQITNTPAQIVMLGTGMPRPDPERSGPATAVVVNGSAYIVDCGPGVVRRAAAAAEKGVTALRAPNLKTVFITHLHSDHTIGYPDIILTPWVMGRTEPLQAFGPKGLARMTKNLLAAYREDLDIRVHGLEHDNDTGWKVDVHEIAPGLIYQDSNVKVTAIPVKHGSWKYAFGYRFDTPGRVIVISGDTAPCDALVQAAMGADVLVHEVYDDDELAPEKRPGGDSWAEYMRSFHTSARELGAIALKCQPKLLVLYHVVRHGGTDEALIRQVHEGGFQGPVVVAKDLDIY
jgi:ribonuclease BN (tRNA processing enzyme)